jgi:hypothetical protein
MPRVGYEHTISAFERANTVHALESATTVIGEDALTLLKYLSIFRAFILLILLKKIFLMFHIWLT